MKAIDEAIKITDTELEGPEADREIEKLVKEQIVLVGKARAIYSKLAAYESKFKKFKWAGTAVAYTKSAARKLQDGIDNALDDLERSLNSL